MDYIKDAIEVNKSALKKTIKSIKYLPIISLAIIIIVLAQGLGNVLVNYVSNIIPSRFLVEIILYIIEVITLSILMSSLYAVIIGSRLTVKNFTDGWQRYIGPLMATRFIFWLIEYALGLLMISGPLIIVLSFIYTIFISNMLETIYIDGQSGTNAVVSMVNFLKDNLIQWLPVAIITSIFMTYLNKRTRLLFVAIFDLKLLIPGIISIFVIAFIFIYKGHLYDILNDSSMRKRKFQGVFDRWE